MSPPLFIGRFQPFHLGHLDAIKCILQRHKKIIIAIGSAQYSGLPKNPFPAHLREKMIIASLTAAGIPKRKITLVKIPDINNDSKWVSHVEHIAPQFGVVYSGTPKVQKLFKKNGKHQVLSPRFNLAISATEIRRKIKLGEAWEHLVSSAVVKILKLCK